MSDEIPNPPGDQIVWEGNPSWWRWTGWIVVGVITLPVVIGIFILSGVWLARKMTRYRITQTRILREDGLFTIEAKELLIRDIRGISVRRTPMGWGDIEFVSTAKEAEILFTAVPECEKVHALVQGLQG